MSAAAVPDEPWALAQAAADALAAATGVAAHDVLVVLGSGWDPAADLLGDPVAELVFTDLPGFPPSTVVGHAGKLRSVRAGDRRVLVLMGRVHLYEGHAPWRVVHGVRMAAAAGCRTALLTNACGGVNADYRPGQPVLLRDHLNLTGVSPLTGPVPPNGERFVSLTSTYSARLREIARAIDPTLTEGVYAGFHGPEYETPAEIEMVRRLGADLVGMSTVLEAIAARHVGLELLGLSLVTNLAAGITGAELDHHEVLAAGKAAASRMGALLRQVIERS